MCSPKNEVRVTITSHLFEAYLKCPTKCFLRSHGEAGTGNAYADWVRIQSESYRRNGIKCLAVVYCENAKRSGMWLNSHGVSMRGLYYPRGVLPNCCKPRVSARPFWMRLWVETTVAVR